MKTRPLYTPSRYLFLLVLLAGCRPHDAVTVEATPRVSALTLAPVAFDVTEELQGRVTAIRAAEIRPQVSGIVQKRLFEQGSEVIAGEPLFQINPQPFQIEVDSAAAALKRAEATLVRERLQVKRLEPLLRTETISRQHYDDAVSTRDQAAADVAQARANLDRRLLDLQFATVVAPISGRIDQSLISEGALVSSSDSSPLARIQQIDQVYVDVRRPASSLDTLREALAQAEAEAQAEAQDQDQSGLPVALLRSNGQPYPGSGRILFSGVSVDPGTGDVLLRILVDNPQRRFLPGMFLRARVPQARYPHALTIPQQAVVRSDGKAYVWTISAQRKVHRRAITLAELVAQHYRVSAGLRAGERIVVEGMERLTEDQQVDVQDWTPTDASSLPH